MTSHYTFNPSKNESHLPRLARSISRENKESNSSTRSSIIRRRLPTLKSTLAKTHPNLVQRYEKCVKLAAISTHKSENLAKRIMLINSLHQQYGIIFKDSDIKALSNDSLHIKAVNFHLNAVQHAAACKINQWCRKRLIIKRIKKNLLGAEESARIIQRSWRKHILRRNLRCGLRTFLTKCNDAATLLQKVFRGWLGRKTAKELRMSTFFERVHLIRMKILGEFFDKVAQVKFRLSGKQMILRLKQNVVLKSLKEKLKENLIEKKHKFNCHALNLYGRVVSIYSEPSTPLFPYAQAV